MLYREIIAVCSEIHRKHINTVCVGQNVELCFNIKPGGTDSNFEGLNEHQLIQMYEELQVRLHTFFITAPNGDELPTLQPNRITSQHNPAAKK